jgi:hypothetical protein
MEFYKPSQYLSLLFYREEISNLYLKSRNDVLISANEALGSRMKNVSGDDFDVDLNIVNDDEYDSQYIDSIQVVNQIRSDLNINVVDKTEDEIRTQIKTALGSSYQSTVSSKVIKKDGSPGGKATNTIDQDGDIEIL